MLLFPPTTAALYGRNYGGEGGGSGYTRQLRAKPPGAGAAAAALRQRRGPSAAQERLAGCLTPPRPALQGAYYI